MCQICAAMSQASGSHPLHIGAALVAQEFDVTQQEFSPGNSTIAAMLESFSWSGTAGTSANVPFSFDISVEGGAVLSTAGRAAAQAVLQQAANVANITFSPVATSAAKLTFSQADLGLGTLGLTSTFFSGSTIASSEVQVDDRFSQFTPGESGYLTMLHEVGHALGLKHPGNYSGFEDGPFLPASEDTNDATVMSYNYGTYASVSNQAQSFMIYDIMALQYLYGANSAYNSGDNTYSYNGAANASTIWDGAGTDVVSAQPYSGGGVTIDLREGLSNVTSIGSTFLWMAVGANIENAEGSNSNDALYGNSLANILLGMPGADTVHGSDGGDTIYGGTGVVDPDDGNDTLYGEGGGDYILGNGGDDVMYGGVGVADANDLADTMYGGGGADYVIGNGGGDSLFGGGATVDPNDNADTVYGGGGSDTVLGNGGNDSLFGGGATADPNDAADLIYGGRGNDYILGNGGNDTIYGNEENDTMHAGNGNDIYAFYDANGADLILAFDNPGATAGDTIQVTANINGTGIASASDVLARVAYANGQAVIDFGAGNTLTIDGVADGSMTVDDFLIV